MPREVAHNAGHCGSAPENASDVARVESRDREFAAQVERPEDRPRLPDDGKPTLERCHGAAFVDVAGTRGTKSSRPSFRGSFLAPAIQT